MERTYGRQGSRILTSLVVASLIQAAASAGEYLINRPPYPGSREHVGFFPELYPPFYDARSLVKNQVFAEHAAETPQRLVDFAEPKSYYLLTARAEIRSRDTHPPVKVLRMAPGDKPFLWRVGRLPVGTYMLRIIGAIPAGDQVSPPKHLVISLKVKDRPDGSSSWYVLRGRGVDSFYCVQEFGIHVDEERELAVELQLLEDSETTLYCYNLEIHDVLAGCAKRAGKKAPSFFTLREREVARKEFAVSPDPKARELRDAIAKSARSYTPEQRRQRDDELWHSVPGINLLINENYLSTRSGWEIKGLIPDYGGATAQDQKTWDLNRRNGGRYFSEWDRRFALVFDSPHDVGRRVYAPQELYTLEDLRSHKPLGDTGDRGWGVKRDNRLICPLARINRTAWEAVTRTLDGLEDRRLEHLPRYHLGGDEAYARDLAVLLCRLAYDMPLFSLYHTVGFVGSRDDLPWIARRYYAWNLMNIGFADSYDRLFPFIHGNQELADAVGRYIKWVKTPQDVVKLLDTNLIQYLVQNIFARRYEYGNDNVDMLFKLAVIQGDGEISAPWLERMYTQGVVFQLTGTQPVPHALSTATKRDGTTEIGSQYYSADGGPALDAAKYMDLYLRHGGWAKYDLRDEHRFPESIAGCYWPWEGMVAGLWSLGIGDVGGPSVPYGRPCDPAMNAVEGWRWTRDPRFAWLLVNLKGRRYETDEEWADIAKAAAAAPDPIMNKRSRVLPDWSGILETGVGAADFRFHTAAAVRTGWGRGHHHHDALDLRVWAHGLTMVGDYGQRPGYGKPDHVNTLCHNVVQVDEQQNAGHSWVSALADTPGVQYLQAEAVPAFPGALRRQTALVDADGGKPSARAKPWLDPDVVTPQAYVFDVFRAQGGTLHTFCFHGCVDDLNFEVNIPEANRTLYPRDATAERDALEKADVEARYLRDFRWTRSDYRDEEGKAVCYMGNEFRPRDADWAATCPADVLEATWRLARKAEERMVGGINPDQGIGGAATSPRKYTRLHLFQTKDLRVLHGIVIDKPDHARINPDYPHYAGRQLMVRKPGGESVFISLIEPFAGESFIRGRRLLNVEPVAPGLNGPVAVEVQVAIRAGGAPAGERLDVLFADNSGQLCSIPAAAVTVRGEFASIQKTGGHVVRATLVGGTQLKVDDLEIVPALSRYRAKIAKIDYRTRELTLDQFVPTGAFRGAFVEIGDDLRRSNHEVAGVVERDGVSVLKIRKSLELKRTRTDNLTPAGNGRTQVKVPITHFAENGLWVSNGNYSRLWRMEGEFLAQEFTLLGSATPDDFAGDRADVISLEIGPGQEVVLAAQVALSRTPDGGYTVETNVPVKVKLPGRSWQDYTPGNRNQPGLRTGW